jgi:hypothetical protein
MNKEDAMVLIESANTTCLVNATSLVTVCIVSYGSQNNFEIFLKMINGFVQVQRCTLSFKIFCMIRININLLQQK